MEYYVLVVFGVTVLFSLIAIVFYKKKSVDPKDDTWETHILPHDEEFTQIGPTCWMIEGKIPNMFTRSMVVCRVLDISQTLADYETPLTPVRRSKRIAIKKTISETKQEEKRPLLLIHNPIVLNEAGMSQLESLGEPAVIIAPNSFHRMDINVYHKRYPNAKIVCPRAAIQKISEKLHDGTAGIHGACEDVLPQEYNIQFFEIPGLAKELAYRLPMDILAESPVARDYYALTVADALFNLKEGGFIPRCIFGSVQGKLGVPPLGRFFIGKANHPAYTEWLRTVANDELLRAIIVGHGAPIVGAIECKNALLQAAEDLVPFRR